MLDATCCYMPNFGPPSVRTESGILGGGSRFLSSQASLTVGHQNLSPRYLRFQISIYFKFFFDQILSRVSNATQHQHWKRWVETRTSATDVYSLQNFFDAIKISFLGLSVMEVPNPSCVGRTLRVLYNQNLTVHFLL